MKFKELEKLLKKAGWTLYSTRGSHFYYVHPRQPNKVTVPNHKGDIPIGTFKTSRFRFSERVILCYQCILRAFIKKKTDNTP